MPSKSVKQHLALWLLLLVSLIASLAIGASSTNPLQLLNALISNNDSNLSAIFWEVRVPRTLAAALVGIALAQAGWALQAIHSNPLADPALLGHSAIAAVAALITFGFTNSILLAIVAGFALSLIANELILRVKISRENFLVGAFAVGSGATALLGTLATSPLNDSGRSLTSWIFGSLSGATLEVIPIIFVLVAVSSLWLSRMQTELDLLSLGDRMATNLGLNTLDSRRKIMIVTAVMTSASVALVGIVSFVGLLVPHFVRRFFSGRHKSQQLAVILGGAAAVMIADVISRSAFSPIEIPLGITFALFGAPLMFWMLSRGESRE